MQERTKVLEAEKNSTDIAGFEDGRGHEPRNTSALQKLAMARKFSPRASKKEDTPANTLILA